MREKQKGKDKTLPRNSSLSGMFEVSHFEHDLDIPRDGEPLTIGQREQHVHIKHTGGVKGCHSFISSHYIINKNSKNRIIQTPRELFGF